jgi:hypothetical protein
MQILTDNEVFDCKEMAEGAKEKMIDLHTQKGVITSVRGKTGYGMHMGIAGKNLSFYGGVKVLLATVTWLVIIALLVAMARYFWKKGDK